jgi:serine/tyrosine/threonine adenylyltransferase
MTLNIKDTFNKELPADPNDSNEPRQVSEACYSFVTPRVPSDPELIHVTEGVAALLGLSKDDLESDEFLQIVSGSKVYAGTKPYAMCYGGHQFGHWAGQLGDGRAINLMEVNANHGNGSNANLRLALQLKGSGETPYSRSADGLAVLRSSIREHLCSEAMHHLGVPTTRSLSLVKTGDPVLRDKMYDGNSEYEQGAVVCRVAPSFIRFGNFEIFAARKDYATLKKLTDYTIKHFYSHIKPENTVEVRNLDTIGKGVQNSIGKAEYIQFIQEVADRTRKMVLDWQRVGFVHGVMNTDNMSILGLTIDFGPYGWLEGYDHSWTPNTTDRQYRRYRYVNQPSIALWNIMQLANALYPLIGEAKPLEDILNQYNADYAADYDKMMHQKLGLTQFLPEDEALIAELEKVLQLTETDMTIFFRNLSQVKKGDFDAKSTTLPHPILDSFYENESLNGDILRGWLNWFEIYQNRLNKEKTSDSERKAAMNAVNPKYVLRNYMAQIAIDAADNGDYAIVSELHELLKNPYSEQPESERWFAKRPDWARHKVGCSMLSCSS